MSIINGAVPMNIDHTRHEEPSTPSKDPLSSPAVHIQWQNSQSACAAMEELRAASSVPRRPPKRLTFDFELPTSTAGPSSSSFTTTTTSSDPFLPSRARSERTMRSRALAHVQSHSQNDVPAVPPADASKFLDMLGRASARVDENSRKRMRAARTVRTLRSPLKGKERVRSAAGTRSLDELQDHTNLLPAASEHRASTSGAHYSSLPVVPPNVFPSQTVGDTTLTDVDADDVPIMDVEPGPCAGTINNTGDPGSTRASGVTQPCSATTGHPQRRAEPPSPTPVRPAPITRHPPLQPAQPPKSVAAASAAPIQPTPLAPPPIAPLASAFPRHPVPTPTRPPADAVAGAATRKGVGVSAAPMTPESLPRRGASAFTTTITPSQLSLSSSQGPRRALGMTRTAPSSALAAASSSKVQHSAAVKRPFRPPRVHVPTKRQSQQQQQQWQQKEAKSPGVSDPDSSFDLAFDFDPEALEVAMRPY
ncbi:hypothetical protein EDB85DRAFT_2030801, partial [Lactarius pseudohatsudake]